MVEIGRLDFERSNNLGIFFFFKKKPTFWEICKKSKDPETIQRKKKKQFIAINDLTVLLESTKDSTRECTLNFNLYR